MRLEAQRANNAAVLRQQVFHFDPNYYPYYNAATGVTMEEMPPGVNGSGKQGLGLNGGNSLVDDNSYANGTVKQNSFNSYAASNGSKKNVQQPANNNYIRRPTQNHVSPTNGSKVVTQPSQEHPPNSQEEMLRQLFPSWF